VGCPIDAGQMGVRARTSPESGLLLVSDELASFQLSEFSKANELHLRLTCTSWLSPAEACFPSNRRGVVDKELSEPVQLEVVPP
jgi:hypothetical protein